MAEGMSAQGASGFRPNEEPLYNIGAVVQMTGIAAATIRAWERRYGFPEASRSPGGHRLFSDAEVLRLRWVKNRVDDGMQPSQAVKALRVREQSGDRILTPGLVDEARAVGGPVTLAGLSDRLVEALVRHETEQADLAMQDAVAAFDPETLMLDVIAPALDRLGVLWEAGDLSIGSEHLASNFLRQRLLMWMLTAPAPRSRPPVVMSCAPGELHEGSLLILATILRRRRHAVAYLGQSMPLPDLAAVVADLGPRLVVVTAMRPETAEALASWPEHLPQAHLSGGPVFGFGGRVFSVDPKWRRRVPGVYLGDTLRSGLQTIERILEPY